MLSSDKLSIPTFFESDDIGPLEKSLTQEIGIALKLISQVHLKSAIHLISGNVIMTRVSMDPENVIRVCKKLVLHLGVNCFVNILSEDLMTKTIDFCEIKTKAELVSYMNEIGVKQFLKDKITAELLRDYCRVMGRNFESTETHSQMLDYVSDEIMISGMENWLKQFPRKLLEDWCSYMNVDFATNHEDTVILDNIMSKIFNFPRKSEIDSIKPLLTTPSSELTEEINQSDEAEISPKRKNPKRKHSQNDTKEKDKDQSEPETDKILSKPEDSISDYSDSSPKKKNRKASPLSLLSEITKSTTKEDLDAYVLKDLQQYCRDNQIPSLGRKSELITRIITFLATGEKPHKRKYNKRKRQ